jgi:hypothetical protein
VTEADIVQTYLEIALADGARADDPRLALLRDMMTDAQLERAKLRIGEELLRRQAPPPRAN